MWAKIQDWKSLTNIYTAVGTGKLYVGHTDTCKCRFLSWIIHVICKNKNIRGKKKNNFKGITAMQNELSSTELKKKKAPQIDISFKT